MHGKDVSRAARRMMDNYGRQAAREAERRARNLLACGASDVAISWQLVAAAIRQIEEAEAASRPQAPGTRLAGC